MTTLDKDQASVSAEPETTDTVDRGEHAQSRAAAAMHELRRLEQRAIELPIVGKLHAPDTHDVAYVAGIAALLAFGAVELPVALLVLGGHVLVKQHHSRYLSVVGEIMEDVWGPKV
jgi:hypothetical protein